MILQWNLLALLLSHQLSRDLGVLNDPLKPHLLMNLQCRAVLGSIRCTRGDPEKLASHQAMNGAQARSHFNSVKHELLKSIQ